MGIGVGGSRPRVGGEGGRPSQVCHCMTYYVVLVPRYYLRRKEFGFYSAVMPFPYVVIKIYLLVSFYFGEE